MKLGLGTVQFGVDYGISNQDGQTGSEEAGKILTAAAGQGIRVLDTAALYGDSEAVLGGLLSAGHSFQVVTKSCKFDTPCISADHARLLEESLLRSLQRLRQSAVYGLLLHSAADLLAEGGERLMERLLVMKQRNLVAKIGVSVYTPQQVEQVLERFPIDLIQLPVNILDQRLIRGGHLAALKRAGVEVHARSAFLQGLLLMDAETLPWHFQSVRPLLSSYRRFLAEHDLTPVQAALGFVTGLNELDVVVCGFNNHAQLLDACAQLTPLDPTEFAAFAVLDETIVDPSQWRL